MAKNDDRRTFNYHWLRALVGGIAFALPMVVVILSGCGFSLDSISASYHSTARDWFVGMLFVVGSFLFAYNGTDLAQALLSKLAAISAWLVAIFPTGCPPPCERCLTCIQCLGGLNTKAHYLAAGVLFAILTYFCLFPFRKGAASKHTPEAGRRVCIYWFCGLTMAVCLGGLLLMKAFANHWVKEYQLTLWAEWAALWAFGLAWVVAGQVRVVGLLVGPNEGARSH